MTIWRHHCHDVPRARGPRNRAAALSGSAVFASKTLKKPECFTVAIDSALSGEGKTGVEHLWEEDEVPGGDARRLDELARPSAVSSLVFPSDVELDEVDSPGLGGCGVA
jgi:hypothetical protein